MSDTRGHPYKFRVTDGVSGTATEISCPDDKTRRDWMDAIKLVGCPLSELLPQTRPPIVLFPDSVYLCQKS